MVHRLLTTTIYIYYKSASFSMEKARMKRYMGYAGRCKSNTYEIGEDTCIGLAGPWTEEKVHKFSSSKGNDSLRKKKTSLANLSTCNEKASSDN